MKRSGEKLHKNFTDECEWRYIPDVKIIDMPQVVDEFDIFCVDTLNQALKIDDKCWLKFDTDDIKYIILKSNKDFEYLLEIIANKRLELPDSNRMLSKIFIWENSEGDF